MKSILTNEKYKGDALLLKEFTVDFLQKKVKKNEGEVPQYYVEGNREPIIEPEVFGYVQTEIARRSNGGSRCGAKVWHSNDKYRRVIYQCNHKYKGDMKCSISHITENEMKDVFIRAVNILLTEEDELTANAQAIISKICGSTELETRQAERNSWSSSSAQ